MVIVTSSVRFHGLEWTDILARDQLSKTRSRARTHRSNARRRYANGSMEWRWAARNRADPRSFSSAPSGRIGLLGGRRHASILRTVFLLSPVFRDTPRREPPSSKTRRRTYAHCLGSRYIALLALYLNKREVYPGDGVSLNFKQQRLDVPALSARRWIGLLCNSSFSASAPTMIQEIEFARDSPLEGESGANSSQRPARVRPSKAVSSQV
jgi:hypothetical protein